MKRLSLVDRVSEADFKQLFYHSHTLTEFVFSLGILNFGGETYFLLKKRLKDLSLDPKKQWRGNKVLHPHPVFVSDDVYFAPHVKHAGREVRDRLLRERKLPYRCAICGNDGVWNGKPLILQVDHINGDHYDNRLENLRFLCPNCHTQTANFSGKNIHRKGKTSFAEIKAISNIDRLYVNEPGVPALKKDLHCSFCGKPITRFSESGLCPECAAKKQRKVKDRPSGETLLKEVQELGFAEVGRKYGVLGNAIKKWLREEGLPWHTSDLELIKKG
jgi:Zn finger protein HypA/HybF involved in hydrogenase expression